MRIFCRCEDAAILNRNYQTRMHQNSFTRIYEIVKKIPKGKVMTYKQVSILADVATPRIVGFALHVNPDQENIPCHRVVFSDGRLTPGFAFGGEDLQRKLLINEGVTFLENGKIDLTQFSSHL